MHLTKRMLSLLLALFFTLLLPLYCFAASNLSPATTITDGAYYYIRNKNSGHYLDAENSLNFNVIQYAYHGALNQTWKAVRISGNTYRLENRSPYYQNQGRKCLSVSEVNDEVDLFYYSSTLTTQRWMITANSDSTFTVKSGWDNKVLQTQNASSASPANVIKATANGSNSQKWYFEKIPAPKSSSSTLKSIFPNEMYWNHRPSSTNWGYTTITDAPCSNHNSCRLNGSCGCNSYMRSIQCNGFAKYIGKRLFGTDVVNWSISSNVDSMYFVKPGDYLRYDGHSVIVLDVSPNGDNVCVVECNYGGLCIIKWERNVPISFIRSKFEYIYKSPYIFIE